MSLYIVRGGPAGEGPRSRSGTRIRRGSLNRDAGG
jgi:hypothetical protein